MTDIGRLAQLNERFDHHLIHSFRYIVRMSELQRSIGEIYALDNIRNH